MKTIAVNGSVPEGAPDGPDERGKKDEKREGKRQKKKTKKTKKPSGNQPHLDLKTELKRICGVDLTSIDGIDVMTALTIVSEIGTDVSRFQDETHFASWLGLTPAKDVTGGKTVGRGKRKVKNRVAVALRTAATTLATETESRAAPSRSERCAAGSRTSRRTRTPKTRRANKSGLASSVEKSAADKTDQI